MTHFISHLHPLLVHLPIGILLIGFVLEIMVRWMGQAQLRPAIRTIIGMGTIAAVLSAVSGYLLSQGGGYDAELTQRHQYWGIGTVLLFSWLWLSKSSALQFPLMVAGTLALVVTGHYGAALTHGAGYLFETEKVETTEAVAPLALQTDINIYAGLIAPVLNKKCGSCHKPEKKKGGLVLITPEGIQAGGETGPVLLAGNPENSLLLKRVHLPDTDEDHMPPKGKPQLTPAEIELLSWWISNGADFQKQLKDQPLPEPLAEKLSAKPSASANPVFAQKVPQPDASALLALKKLNLSVQTTGENEPWLSVSFAGQTQLTDRHWKALEAVSAQLIDLDLSHTDLTAQPIAAQNFPHLIRVNLANTGIGSNALAFLNNAPFLESVNLTNTAVDQAIQERLASLKHLKKLFLWQTGLDETALEALRRQLPGVSIISGANIPADAPMVLQTPKMKYGRSFFDDTAHVELEFPFKGVDIYYTLDEEASPTTQSPKYDKTIILDKTSHIRAFASKAGWSPSAVIDAVFVRKKFAAVGAVLDAPPSPKYPAKGALSLIDGKIADAQGADTWLGYEGEHLTATLDLGAVKPVGKVFVHCLENNAPWIHRPTGIQVFTSVDGKKFTRQATAQFPPNASMGDQKVHLLGCHFPAQADARYVRVKVESLLKNPAWHPGKGQKCWIFVDEVVVE